MDVFSQMSEIGIILQAREPCPLHLSDPIPLFKNKSRDSALKVPGLANSSFFQLWKGMSEYFFAIYHLKQWDKHTSILPGKPYHYQISRCDCL
ncbi:unnamed protein product [Acanthoscelides obtectus]|uniref:Uncharacterized protein n=1 Tax=Acanthoscelides obtectus TaxID=200917 RepID=A0A9P0KG48_ACAOB|nr:unnamed protein product [Acanthoscelides obtectus]CAK1672619.1 hypothetical protein AOBTE_LOCUS29000 [Acanthoscelides obtectus]